MSGHYYEALCGLCKAFLYGAQGGTVVSRVTCPKCGAENLFASSTELCGAQLLRRKNGVLIRIGSTFQSQGLSGLRNHRSAQTPEAAYERLGSRNLDTGKQAV